VLSAAQLTIGCLHLSDSRTAALLWPSNHKSVATKTQAPGILSRTESIRKNLSDFDQVTYWTIDCFLMSPRTLFLLKRLL
jgi:hypothetical protein